MKHSFADIPLLRYKRSSFDLKHSVKTSMSMGKLYPIDVQEVLPGDTFKIKTNCVARLTSEFIRPIMDDIFLDIYHFYVPSRVLFDNFEAVFGQDAPNAWTSPEQVDVPTIDSSEAQVSPKTVGDYMGLPPGNKLPPVSVLPFRAFAKIYDGYFRDQNLIDPMLIQTGDINENEVFNNDSWSPNNYTGQLPNVAKFHDYFTSCLPSPQKGNPVSISIGGGKVPVTGVVPVYATLGMNDNGSDVNAYRDIEKYSAQRYSTSSSSTPIGPLNFGIFSDFAEGGIGKKGLLPYDLNLPSFALAGFLPGANYENVASLRLSATNGTAGLERLEPSYSKDIAGAGDVSPLNLVADLGAVPKSNALNTYSPPSVNLSALPSVTVNDLRLAFQTQKLLEKDARSGGRYVEYLHSHFGVSVSDYTLRGMEYLGGRRIPLNVIQVAQTSASSENENLASLGAFSQTAGRTRATKSFVEHGYVLTVACIRQFHTYQQGVEKMWTRSSRLDFYDPVFANIGEQPVRTYQLFTNSSGSTPFDTVFGYQEAWADYRVRHNRVSGEMRSSADNSLDVWHLADEYDNAPVLGQQFVEETPAYLDRTITVPSSSQDQFIVDFFFKTRAYRVMPVYSVPGLIDHH